jgi:hypothetical protein
MHGASQRGNEAYPWVCGAFWRAATPLTDAAAVLHQPVKGCDGSGH